MLRAVAVLTAVPWLVVWLVAGTLVGSLITPTHAMARSAPPDPSLDQLFAEWQRAVAPWMLDEERRAFAELDTDHDRELFMRAFWHARHRAAGFVDPPEAIGGWWRRFEEARRRFANPTTGLGAWRDARARALLVAGFPDREVAFGGCRGTLRPLRLWWYSRWQLDALGVPRADDDTADDTDDGGWLVFRRRDVPSGVFDPWSMADGIAGLSESDIPWRRETLAATLAFAEEHHCFRKGASEAKTLRRALEGALDFNAIVVEQARRRPPHPDWLDRFAEQRAQGQLRLLSDRVEVGFPGGDASGTVVWIRLTVPTDALRRGPGGQLFDRLIATGDVAVGPYATDRFRHVFHLIGQPPETGMAHLDLYRRLRPGHYRFRLRLSDDRGLAILRRELQIDVPERTESLPLTARIGELTRRNRVSLMAIPSVELRPPGADLVGRITVEAATHGGPIASLDFQLDGQWIATDDTPPWQAEVDLGTQPAAHRLTAVARAPDGRELARDEIGLDPATRPLTVRFAEPSSPGSTALGVVVEGADTVARVEIEVDGRPWAHFDAPPYRFEPPPDGRLLRAVARLADGSTAEAIRPLDERFGEVVDVRAVEVWTTVVDGDGRPIPGLQEADFEVLEEGAPQPLSRFAAVDDLPLRVGLLMDTSESMRGRLSLAAESARRFITHVLRPGDYAAVTTFDHDLWLRAPWTDDLDTLRRGTSGLTPHGGTRLLDALVHAAAYLGGTEGRRALVLLSDGRDVGSDFDFERTHRAILRADVAVYPILLAVDDETTREQLAQIARESGGRLFTIRHIGELDAVYQQIEDTLRSQYLLVYQADAAGSRAFRSIDVEMQREGLTAHSMRGYWP